MYGDEHLIVDDEHLATRKDNAVRWNALAQRARVIEAIIGYEDAEEVQILLPGVRAAFVQSLEANPGASEYLINYNLDSASRIQDVSDRRVVHMEGLLSSFTDRVSQLAPVTDVIT